MGMRETEKAYIAGLYDGEGSFYIRHQTKHYKRKTGEMTEHTYSTPVVKLAMANQEIMEWVYHVLGRGLYYSYQPKKPPSAQRMYAIELVGEEKVEWFIKTLGAFLKRVRSPSNDEAARNHIVLVKRMRIQR